MQDYEREQMFAPLFTPTLEDRADYAELLLTRSVSDAEIEAAISRLGQGTLSCAIEVPGGPDHLLPLEEVLVSRFLRMLRLTGTPPAEVTELLLRTIPVDDRGPALVRRLRDPVKYAWHAAYLDGVRQREGFSLLKFDFLTDQVRDTFALETARILANTEHVLGEKRNNFSVGGSARPFFSRHIEEWHGHSHDHRRFDADEVEQKQRALAMLTDLVGDLQALALAKAQGS